MLCGECEARHGALGRRQVLQRDFRGESVSESDGGSAQDARARYRLCLAALLRRSLMEATYCRGLVTC